MARRSTSLYAPAWAGAFGTASDLPVSGPVRGERACRCMNVPARYCTGYLGDIGDSPDDSPMNFSAWFEVYLGGRWYTFDARHNKPRIGRILMARGRDATDVAIVTSFGPCTLAGFKVITDEVTSAV
jgi:transglutaminase-like putative cysteine protease